MSEVVQEEKKIQGQVWNIIDQNRVLGFSDAVFAFAATLLVLKIDLPQEMRMQFTTNFSAVFTTLWPQYLANIISFLVIGYYWLNHHAIFGLLKRFNATIVWMNLVFLIFLSFLPFPVDLFGDHPTIAGIVVFYSVSLSLVGFLLAIMWWYASGKHRLIQKTMSSKERNYYLTRTLVAPCVFLLSAALVFIDTRVAQVSWIFVIIGILLVNKLFDIKHISEMDKNLL
ncbi:MAG TPA: TMEM175 family protein [Candidatus Saccharimonadales bacterium]|nr:TMEM175 family protein [Candidatus Saccharimonadales bacterium]